MPFAIGAGWALATPSPDLIVTGDGRHLALRGDDGTLAVLRERAGDYVRDVLGESGGVDGELPALDDLTGARCNQDVCLATVRRGPRQWRVLATRSGYMLDVRQLNAACARADIVVSERWLPRGCRPRWLRLDRPYLRQSGGVAVTLSTGAIRRVSDNDGDHPWVDPTTIQPERPGGRAAQRTASGTKAASRRYDQ